MKKTKKEFIKKKIFQVLHVIGYVSSIILLLLCVIAGFKSCNQQSNNNNQSLQNNALQLPVLNDTGGLFVRKYNAYEDSFSVNYTDLRNAYDFYGIDYNKNDYDLDYHMEITFEVESVETSFDYVSQNIKTNLEFYFSVYSDISGNYLRIDTIYLNGYITQEKDSSEPNNLIYYQYDTGYNSRFIYDGEDNPLISLFFKFNKWNYFTFNNQINYMFPFGQTLSSFYGFSASGMEIVVVDTIARVKYDTGLFYSNGEYFNQIWYDLDPAGSSYFDFSTNSYPKIKLGENGAWTYYCMIYKNTFTGRSKIVNMRNLQTYMDDEGHQGSYYLNSSTWLNDNYRYISYCEMSQDTLTKLQGFNNLGVNFTSGNISGTGSDVFTLLTSAFTSLVPFFSVMILPGISIGVLIFTPLVVVVLFAIMKIIKK